MNYLDPNNLPPREEEPDDEDMQVQKIEIQFAVPVYLPPGAVRELHTLINDIVGLKINQLKDSAHWLSGSGQKPILSQQDQRAQGLPVDPSAKPEGEPDWEKTTLYMESTARPLGPTERAKFKEKLK